MAAGVGKTYRMLQEGHAEWEAGHDVAIGLLETHGREDTQRLAEGLPTIPRRTVRYRDFMQVMNTMQGNGLCAGRAEWSTTNIRQSKTCDRTLDGVPKHVFYYETDVLVNRDSGFSVIVEGTGDTWKVTSVGRGGAARQASNGGTLCG